MSGKVQNLFDDFTGRSSAKESKKAHKRQEERIAEQEAEQAELDKADKVKRIKAQTDERGNRQTGFGRGILQLLGTSPGGAKKKPTTLGGV